MYTGTGIQVALSRQKYGVVGKRGKRNIMNMFFKKSSLE
jgi:hypothetical protein